MILRIRDNWEGNIPFREAEIPAKSCEISDNNNWTTKHTLVLLNQYSLLHFEMILCIFNSIKVNHPFPEPLVEQPGKVASVFISNLPGNIFHLVDRSAI